MSVSKEEKEEREKLQKEAQKRFEEKQAEKAKKDKEDAIGEKERDLFFSFLCVRACGRGCQAKANHSDQIFWE